MRLFGLLFLALGVWFIWQHGRELPASQELGAQQAAASVQIPGAPEIAAIDEYTIILERPLFSPPPRRARIHLPYSSGVLPREIRAPCALRATGSRPNVLRSTRAPSARASRAAAPERAAAPG